MSAEDAWFLYFERPNAPLHIGSVGIYEGDIPVEALRASMDARMHLIPRYRQRALIPPLYAAHPLWHDDPQFSLDRHLHEVRLPSPGDERQLLEASAAIFAEMLPRDRPLWDITVVRGLAGNRTAYVSRVHHCLVDGVSGIELLLAVLDLTPNPEPPAPPEAPWRPAEIGGVMETWTEALFDQWESGLRAWGEWQQTALDTRAQMRRATELARALQIALPLALRPPFRAPWNKPIGGKRQIAWTEMSFQEIRRIRGVAGGTVNDVMLTLLGGALGRYLREHGAKTEALTLRLMIPVNVRTEDQKGALGNRVSMMLPELPVSTDDPIERLKSVREEMERRKQQGQADAFEALSSMSANIPAAYHALGGLAGMPQGTINLVCTNVPGPLIPLYTVGHRLLAHYPLVPLAGDLGLGVGITSFDKGLYVGFMADPEIIDDVDLIARYFAEEFGALRAAAGVPESDLPEIGVQLLNGNGVKPAPTPSPARKAAPRKRSTRATKAARR